jgi:hypothetical protein
MCSMVLSKLWRRVESPTSICAIFSHEDFEGGKDLLNGRWWHCGGIQMSRTHIPQVLHQILLQIVVMQIIRHKNK